MIPREKHLTISFNPLFMGFIPNMLITLMVCNSKELPFSGKKEMSEIKAKNSMLYEMQVLSLTSLL